MKNTDTKFRIESLINLNSSCFVNSKFFHGKSLIIHCIIFILPFISIFSLNAANRYAVANGNWNATSTWSSSSGGSSGASIPIAGDVVYVGEGNRDRTVTIPAGYTANCSSITTGNRNDNNNVTIALAAANSSLNVSGTLTINRPNSGSANEISVGNGNLIVGGDVLIGYYTTSSTSTNRLTGITINTGTVIISGNLTMYGQSDYQSQIIFSDAGTLKIGGNFSRLNNLGLFIPATGTVEYNGTNQSGPNVNYNNLIFSNSGTKTITGGSTIDGNVEIKTGCTFAGGTYTHLVAGDWTNNGSFTSTGTVNFNGTSAQSISSSSFNNVLFSNAGVKTATGALTVGGNFEIQSNFTAGSFTHFVSGNWTKTGTFNATGSTINFNGSGTGSIGASNFNHLVFSGTGAKSAIGALSIVGNLTISNNFSGGSFSHNLQGNWINNGSYTAGTSTINLIASTPQTIGGSSVTTFYNLTQNGTGLVTLAASTNVSGTLNMALGNIDIATYNLKTANISGGSANSYVKTTNTGKLIQPIDYNVTKSFPVGRSAYNPASIKNNTVGGLDDFYVGVTDDPITNANANTKTVKRRWYIYKGNAGYANLTMSLTYNSGEEETGFNAGSNPKIGFFSGTYWGYGNATVNGTTFTSTSAVQNANESAQFLTLGSDDAFSASKLAIIRLEPINPSLGVANTTVFVQSQNSMGIPNRVYTNTSFALTAQNTTFTGTSTGTIAAGTNDLTIAPLTFTTSTYNATTSTYNHNATLTATQTSGENLTVGVSGLFDVYAAKIYEPKATGNWSSATNWRYSIDGGSSWRDTTSLTTFSENELIRIPAGITLTTNTNVSFYSTIVLGTLDVPASGSITINHSNQSDYNLHVHGVLRNSGGTITNNNSSYPDELLEIHGGTYEHTMTGGSVPLSHWTSLDATKSTCIINGEGVSGLNQTFENFTLTSGTQTLTSDLNVSGVLTLTNGKITTNSYNAIVGLTGSITYTNGYINGNLRRYIPNGTTSVDLPVGDSNYAAPITISLVGGSITGQGYIDVSSSIQQPPFASGLSQTKYINRNWTIHNNGISGFTSLSATFTYNDNDKVGSPSTNLLSLRKIHNNIWYTTNGTATGNVMSVSGLMAPDHNSCTFYIGESDCSSTEYFWLGTTNTDWNTASNWCSNQVPTNTVNVTIPGGIVNNPVITAAATCNNISIYNGGNLSISGTNTLEIKGNWSNNGTFSGNSGTVLFSGTSEQLITGATTYNNLSINNSAGVSANDNITLNGSLLLSSSNPSAVKGTLDMGTDTLSIVNQSATINGSGDVTGIIKRKHVFMPNSVYQFGNQYTSISFLGLGGTQSSEISCKTVIGSVPTWKSEAVKRTYSFSQTGGTDQINLKLHYLDSEINALQPDETQLNLWDAHGGSGSWGSANHPHGKSDYDASNNWISLTGLTIDYVARPTLDNKQFALAYNTSIKNTWTGANNTNWNNTANWSAGNIPYTTDEVLISTAPRYPILSTDIEIATLEIAAGASVTTDTCDITINGYNGAWNNKGTFNPGTATVKFMHNSLSEVVNISGNTQFYNIFFGPTTFVQPGSGAYTKISGMADGETTCIIDLSVAESTIEFNGDNVQYIINPNTPGFSNSGYHHLVFSGNGEKILYANELEIAGNFTNNATFNVSNGTVTFKGSAAQIISGTKAPIFSNITINNVLGVTSDVNITVNGTLNLLSDNPVSLDKGTLNVLAGDTLKFGADALVTGTGDITGLVYRKHNFITNYYYAFGAQNTGVTFTDYAGQTLPTSITLHTSIGTAPDWTGTVLLPGSPAGASAFPANPIKRMYKIAQTGGANTSGVFRVHYKDNEIPANTDESTLTLWNRVKQAGTFYGVEKGKSNQDVANNYLSIQNVNFSNIPSVIDNFNATVASSEAVYHTWIGNYSTDWNNTLNWYPVGVPASTDAVIIPSSNTVAYVPSIPTNGTCRSIVIQPDGILNAVDNASLSLYGHGDVWNIENGGTFNTGNSTIVFAADASTVGDMSISGYSTFHNITVSSNSVFRPGEGSGAAITGTFVNNGTIDAITNTNTFEFKANGNQTIPNTNGSTAGYHDLVISGTGIKTLPTTLKIAGDFTNNGTVDAGTSTVTIQDDGNNQIIGGSSTTTYHNLTINNTGKLVTATNNFNVNNILTVNTTLDMGTNSIGGSLVSTDGTGTLKTKSTSANSLPSGKTWTMPIIYYGSAAQTAPAGTYNSLTIDNLIGTSLGESSITTLLLTGGSRLTTSGTTTATNVTLEYSAVNGPATIVDNGTLTTTNSIVKQDLSGNRNWYVSSPVVNATTAGVAGQGYSFWSYDEPTAAWITSDTELGVAKGYIVNKTAAGTLNFAGGTLNTGSKTVNLDRHIGVLKAGFNLVGNPYPSYLDWTAVSKTKIMSTIWYRTKNNSGAYVFDTYNNGIGTNNNGSGDVSGIIAPMGAFWVRVDSTGMTKGASVCSGSFTMDNSMRLHEPAADGNNNRLKAPAASQGKQQILRMQVSNGVNVDEAIVLFNPKASNGYDTYDSPKMTNANVAIPEIYTKVGTENLVINGLNSIDTNPFIPLGFTTGMANTFTIRASEVSNFDASIQIVLIDNELNTEKDITDGSEYSFKSNKITTIDRFKIAFRTIGTITETNNTSENNNSFVLYKNNNGEIVVNIKGDISPKASVSIYNAIGQKLISKQCNGETTVINHPLTTGVYYVSVSNEDGTMTKKIVFN